MKKYLTYIVIFPLLGFFSPAYSADDSEKPKYTDEQLNKLKAAEEKYKDNPKVLELISNIKADAGITDTPAAKKDPGPPPITAHGKVITQGSYDVAEEAFRNDDKETAIAHYKVLAAEGDPEASLKLGYIYEQEGDNQAAYAAYKNAAESEHDTKDSKMASERLKWLEKDVMSDEEIEQANQALSDQTMPDQTTANSKQSNKAAGASSDTSKTKNTSVTQYRPITSDAKSSQVSVATGSDGSFKPGRIKITPQKMKRTQHFKAEKFSRSVSK